MEIGTFGLGFKSGARGLTHPCGLLHAAAASASTRNAVWRRFVGSSQTRIAPRSSASRTHSTRRSRLARIRVLAQFMKWADTIVVMPRDTGAVDWLSESISTFPAEFLLFSSHVERLVLDEPHRLSARAGSSSSKRRVTTSGELHDRGDARGKTAWKLFSATHTPSAAVRRDGGKMAERALIPVHWAVPIEPPGDGTTLGVLPHLRRDVTQRCDQRTVEARREPYHPGPGRVQRGTPKRRRAPRDGQSRGREPPGGPGVPPWISYPAAATNRNSRGGPTASSWRRSMRRRSRHRRFPDLVGRAAAAWCPAVDRASVPYLSTDVRLWSEEAERDRSRGSTLRAGAPRSVVHEPSACCSPLMPRRRV